MLKLEIVITRAAPTFHKLFMVMGCVFDTNTVHKTVEKLAGAIIITVTNKLLNSYCSDFSAEGSYVHYF